ncbi:MAG TPA: discoidin domain-containing protein [Candidatus Krumholzibacteria bacterium]|nr:discoidin domain-containing protein [Candidatus Krumholzibacteria bacterium]
MRAKSVHLILAFGCLLMPAGAANCQVASDRRLDAKSLVVDDFEDPSQWSVHPADGVDLVIRSEAGLRGRCLRLDFDFHGGGGYAVARRTLALELPENYAFSFRLRGEAPPNHLEFKLVDASGDNVWWHVRRDVRFGRDWETVTIKKRHITFAWGPLGGGEIRQVAALEFAITAGSGGKGTVWIDELELRTLPPPNAVPPQPVARASSVRGGSDAARATDGDGSTSWESASNDAKPWIELDLGESREFGGLALDWEPGRHPTDYDIECSDDGTTWRTVRSVRGGNGGRDLHYLPESESRRLRVNVRRGPERGVALREITIQSLAWSATRTAFFEAVAREAPRGTFPRGMSGEQNYWTVVGVDRDAREALFGEDGALEIGRGEISIEPFLWHHGQLVTWADVETEHFLEEGSLPIPSVRWRIGDLELLVTAFATGEPGRSAVIARYRVRNRGGESVQAKLFLALRPFQVNPPTQSLNLLGGTAPLRSIAFEGDRAIVNETHRLRSLSQPAASGAVHFDGGDIVADFLRRGVLPPQQTVKDEFEAASGAIAYSLDLAPGEESDVGVVVPLYAGTKIELPAAAKGSSRSASADAAQSWVEERLERCRVDWREKLDRVVIELPDSAVTQSLRAQIGWILVNRAGAAIQPGTRSYARSWIRDGALTSSALLRVGHADAARDFLAWFAPHQYANGKVPCVVDSRGADPTPEHDSTGEFIFLATEVLRMSGDRALAERLWPRVLAGAAYLDSLRSTRRTADYQTPANRHFFGLLPPSISHEGYSAKPMHSYWDDFWAVRGFRDAVFLAEALGRSGDRDRLVASRDEFEHDVAASVMAAIAHHRIDYVPGCADMGDFDATSTTILLSPVQAEGLVPKAALERTFAKYLEFSAERSKGAPWEAFTPYEIRNIGACVRLGWRERANELLQFFLATQRPHGWRQWPEVVWQDERTPRFLGDLPHGWVGSDYIRSVLDMLAYENEADDTLVLAAGVPVDWLRDKGVVVRNLSTSFGPLSYSLGMRGDEVALRIESGLRLPAGGVVVRAPTPWPIGKVVLDGATVSPGPAGEIVLRNLPATLVLRR